MSKWYLENGSFCHLHTCLSKYFLLFSSNLDIDRYRSIISDGRDDSSLEECSSLWIFESSIDIWGAYFGSKLRESCNLLLDAKRIELRCILVSIHDSFDMRWSLHTLKRRNVRLCHLTRKEKWNYCGFDFIYPTWLIICWIKKIIHSLSYFEILFLSHVFLGHINSNIIRKYLINLLSREWLNTFRSELYTWILVSKCVSSYTIHIIPLFLRLERDSDIIEWNRISSRIMLIICKRIRRKKSTHKMNIKNNKSIIYNKFDCQLNIFPNSS